MFRRFLARYFVLAAACFAAPLGMAGDWPRFLGPGGTGVSGDAVATPVRWSETENKKWQVELPGRGVSSPIVVGDRIFVTCYSGYGTPEETDARLEDLERHLLCIDREDGEVLWQRTVPAAMPEDPYDPPGVTSHGYASHTPVSDGERVYVFFGKSGVFAFDLEGKQLWQQDVGKESGRMQWGSAASPIVWQDLLIVNASDESEALVALQKNSGEEVWRKEAAGLGNTWGTPVVIGEGDDAEVVVSVPGEIWGFDARTGDFKWYADATSDDSTTVSPIPGEDLVFAVGGRGGEAVAVRPGGEGDVSDTNTVWEGRVEGRFSTPVLYNGHIYAINAGVVSCFEAETGERVYQERLPSPAAGEGGSEEGRRSDRESPRDADRAEPAQGGRAESGDGAAGTGRGGSRGGRGGGRFGNLDYASPVVADGKLYVTLGNGTFYVLRAAPEFQVLAVNRLSDDSGFGATPAISNGELFLRSHAKLYCIADEG